MHPFGLNRTTLFLLVCVSALGISGRTNAEEPAVDLTRAVIVTPPGLSGPEKKAVALLVDEVEKPAPRVITITEFEETDIREAGAGEEPPQES